MKRSHINASIKFALKTLEDNNLKLPPFGYWKLDDWKSHTAETGNIKKIMLGWDVTDFGTDRFDEIGATLFTVRNGSPSDRTIGTPYAEKLIIMQQKSSQEIPYHFHRIKTEDIINRGGGILVLQLYNSAPDESLDETSDVIVKMDGIFRTFKAGSLVEVEKGASITLQPRLYHRFYAKAGCGDLVVGEISSINDDNTDNRFLKDTGRFAKIDEDEPAIYPLCNELETL